MYVLLESLVLTPTFDAGEKQTFDISLWPVNSNFELKDSSFNHHNNISAINCTSEPFLVRNNDMGMFNWTGVDGVDPRPYATAIRYLYFFSFNLRNKATLTLFLDWAHSIS